ncbi:MAG: hypothetical protein AB8B77_08740 [Alphaproteobacteria bacterium]
MNQDESAKFCWIGWVPSITGRLSFSLIGHSEFPYPAKYFNSIRRNKRYVIVYQKRWPRDGVLLSIKIIRDLMEEKNRGFGAEPKTESRFHHCFFIANSNIKEVGSDELLIGTIYFVRNYKKLDNLNKKINAFMEKHTQQDISCLEGDFTKIKAVLDTEIVQFNVALKRSGKAEISVNGDGYESSEHAKPLANSAYFFLRDIAHQHKHHSPTKDTIATLNDIKEWKFLTLQSLMHAVLSGKRTFSTSTNAAGILAYARSFCRTIVRPSIKSSPPQLQQIYDAVMSDEILASHSILQARKNAKRSARNHKISTFTAIMLGYLAITVSAFGILGSKSLEGHGRSGMEEFLAGVLQFSISSPYALLVPLVIILAFIYQGTKSFENNGFLNIAYRLFMKCKKNALVTLILLAIFASGFSFMFFTGLLFNL